MPFQDNLKRVRKSKQLSQEELAELLDVSRQAVSKWEQGICMPEAQMLLRLSEKLDVSLDELMSESVEAINNDSESGGANSLFPEEDKQAHKKFKKKMSRTIIFSSCAIILCIVIAVILRIHTNEISPDNQETVDSPIVATAKNEDDESQEEQTEETDTMTVLAEENKDNYVFTTKEDRRIIAEIAADFAQAYFEQSFDKIATFLSPFFEGNPKEVCPWEGIDTFFIKGVDSISSEKADGTKTVSVEFRNPDYPDSFLYLSVVFIKENEEWKVLSYYLEA